MLGSATHIPLPQMQAAVPGRLSYSTTDPPYILVLRICSLSVT